MGSDDVLVRVRVLGVSRVMPSRRPHPHGHGERVTLSFMDTPLVGQPPIQAVFLYQPPDDGGIPATAVSRMKAALAETLVHYLPLAGILEYVADTGDLVVDLSGDVAGVAFVEAEAAGTGMDVRRLASDEAHDLAAFLSFVPELDTQVLPAPLLSVQVTRLATGLAVGMSFHHAFLDGRSCWRFIEAWSSASRVGSPVTELLGPPRYGREIMSHPRGAQDLARVLLKIAAPNLPAVVSRGASQGPHLALRTFYFSADDIRSTRQRIDNLAAAADLAAAKPKPVSRFVAVAALGWTAFVHSKGLGAAEEEEENTHFVFAADLRSRLHPPVSDAYLGNCARPCVARCAKAAELAGEDGILHAARAVQAAVAEMEASPLSATDESLFDMRRQLPKSRVATVVSSSQFRIYEAGDFGFGRPVRVEMVSMNGDGLITLFAGRRDGEVQVSVTLDPVHMDAFKASILGQPMQRPATYCKHIKSRI